MQSNGVNNTIHKSILPTLNSCFSFLEQTKTCRFKAIDLPIAEDYRRSCEG